MDYMAYTFHFWCYIWHENVKSFKAEVSPMGNRYVQKIYILIGLLNSVEKNLYIITHKNDGCKIAPVLCY